MHPAYISKESEVFKIFKFQMQVLIFNFSIIFSTRLEKVIQKQKCPYFLHHRVGILIMQKRNEYLVTPAPITNLHKFYLLEHNFRQLSILTLVKITVDTFN